MRSAPYFCIGALLFFASVMKAHALSNTIVNPQKIQWEWWGTLGVVSAELFLAAWLTAGIWFRASRIVTIAFFTVFSTATIYKLVLGEKSCGCLGNFRLHPAYTFAVDVVVLGVLWRVRPEPRQVSHRLTKFCFLSGFALLALGMSSWVYVKSSDLSRGLVIDTNFHEFGEVAQNEVLTWNFTLYNNCTYPVEVVQTTSTCSCTTVDGLSGQEIAAGESMQIPVSLRTRESDEHLAGRITLFCRPVGSDSPPTLFQDLMVAAQVQPDYWLRPLIVDFGVIRDDLPKTEIIRLRPHWLPEVAVNEIANHNPVFRTRVLNERTTEGDIQIELTFDGTMLKQSGATESAMRLKTNSPKRPEVSFLARAYFHPPIEAHPDAVVVPSDSNGMVVRDILITGVQAFRIDELRTSNGKVSATSIEESPTRWKIRLSLSGETETAGIGAEVRFKATPTPTDAGSPGLSRNFTIPVFRLAKRGDSK